MIDREDRNAWLVDHLTQNARPGWMFRGAPPESPVNGRRPRTDAEREANDAFLAVWMWARHDGMTDKAILARRSEVGLAARELKELIGRVRAVIARTCYLPPCPGFSRTVAVGEDPVYEDSVRPESSGMFSFMGDEE